MESTLAAPAARQAVFETFLSALRDVQGGARLHALLAPAAVVPTARGLRPVSEVAVDEFARQHAELASQNPAELPDFAAPQRIEGAGIADAGQAVDWFDVLETRLQRRLVVGVGFEGDAAGTRIGWSRIAPQVEPLGYRQGYLRSLCDYSWMSRGDAVRARLLLDASYFRMLPRDDVRFDVLEDARFSCHMSSVCCRIDFEIDVDPAAQLLLDSIPWQALGLQMTDTRLPVRADGRLQLKLGSEACRFLGPQRQCLVHQVCGTQPFATCAVYPYAFAHTDEGVAVAMSTVCPSARAARGSPPAQNRTDLLERLAQVKPRQTDVYRLAPDRPVTWEIFRDVERALQACIALPELPLRRRLYLASRTLGAVLAGEPLLAEQWLGEPIPAIQQDLRTALRTMLAKILDWDRPTLRALPRELPAQLDTLEFAEPEMLARTLRNMLHSKSYSYEYDLAAALSFAIVLYLVALVMQAAQQGPLGELHWQDLGALGMHGMLKQMLREGVPEGFRALMGTADFGQWLLAL